jgi:hypothetical protein
VEGVMPWIQFKVPDEEYEQITRYAQAKDRDPGNLALHALRQMMRRYPLRESEIEDLRKRHGEGPER